MKLISNWFKKNLKLSEKEEDVFTIVNNILLKDDTRIEMVPENFGFIIDNEPLHMTIVISPTYIAITNTLTFSKEDYRDEFLSLCKENVLKKVKIDREKRIENVLKREKDMRKRLIDCVS